MAPLDTMHVADCNGAANIVAGPILKYLVSLRQLGPNQRSRLQAINSRLVAYYDDNPGSPRMPAIRMSNFGGLPRVGCAAWAGRQGGKRQESDSIYFNSV